MSNLIFLYHFPETPSIRIGWCTLKNNPSGTCKQWPINNVTVPGNPSRVSGTPIDIIRSYLEYIAKRIRGVDHISPTGMHHSLWFPS